MVEITPKLQDRLIRQVKKVREAADFLNDHYRGKAEEALRVLNLCKDMEDTLTHLK